MTKLPFQSKKKKKKRKNTMEPRFSEHRFYE